MGVNPRWDEGDASLPLERYIFLKGNHIGLKKIYFDD